MQLENPEVKKTVLDVDFLFTSGLLMPVTLDWTLGDTMTEDDLCFKIHLKSRPSLTDQSKTLPSEYITLYKTHLISIQQREREVLELSPDQKEAWEQTLRDLTVQ